MNREQTWMGDPRLGPSVFCLTPVVIVYFVAAVRLMSRRYSRFYKVTGIHKETLWEQRQGRTLRLDFPD